MASAPKPCKMPAAQRKQACGNNYKENADGKWVRIRAFREIDYAEDGYLNEFENFDAAFAFDEARREDGTGGRHAKHYPKPKDSVPADQLALKRHIQHTIFIQSNRTRVQMEDLREEMHARFDERDELTAAEHLAAYKKKEAVEKASRLEKRDAATKKRDAAMEKRRAEEKITLQYFAQASELLKPPEGASAKQLRAHQDSLKAKYAEEKKAYQLIWRGKKIKEAEATKAAKNEGGPIPGLDKKRKRRAGSSADVAEPARGKLSPMEAPDEFGDM